MEFTQGVRFDMLGLMPEMRRALEKKGIAESTPVQAGCIPPMRAWRDVIAKAPTGTGKTFAFGIPIVEHIGAESEAVQAVILAPTRELAMQITGELRELCAFLPGIRTVCLYGGAPIGKQIEQLKKRPQIVVATPGRLSDHMKRRTVRLDRVDTVVLDEADRMLDMGFIHDVTRIMDKIPSRRNLGMFSATISREVLDISWMYQRDPEEITVPAEDLPFVSAVIEVLCRETYNVVLPAYYDSSLKIKYTRDNTAARMIDIIHDHYGNGFPLAWDDGLDGALMKSTFYNCIENNNNDLASRIKTYQKSTSKQLGKIIDKTTALLESRGSGN